MSNLCCEGLWYPSDHLGVGDWLVTGVAAEHCKVVLSVSVVKGCGTPESRCSVWLATGVATWLMESL